MRVLLSSVALGAALAAAPAAAQVDRSSPPAPGPAPNVTIPPVEKRTLSNGLPVWIVERHEVPVVQVDLMIRTGTAADPAGKFGLASMTAAMLDEGAGARNALQIADAIDYLGAELHAVSGIDSSSVRLHVAAARLGEALSVMADVAERPTFPQAELDRIRDERLTDLEQARDDPAAIGRFAFPLVVFGPSHRYGTASVGTTQTLKSFTVDDLRGFYGRHYQPSNSLLVVVGDVRPDGVMPLLEGAFGSWKVSGPTAAPALPEPPQLKARRVVIVDKPGAAQSQIRIGWVGVARTNPDYFPLVVLNTLLGGSFTSRLNQNLREQHGYTYGAGSSFDMRRVSGVFVAAAGVQTDKTADSLREFFKELNGVLQPIPAAEVARARNYVALGFPRQFESTRDITAAMADLFVHGLAEDYYGSYMQKVQAVTAGDVARVAKTYIQPERFAVVIVGDRNVIEGPVKALNLGPITVMTTAEAVR